MKNVSPANNSARKFAAHGNLWVTAMRNLTPQRWKIARALSVSVLLLGVALTEGVKFLEVRLAPWKETERAN